MSDEQNEIAASIIRKFVADSEVGWGGCVLIESWGALIDSSWVDLTPEEIAYLRALKDEYRTANEAAAAVVDTGEAQNAR